MNTVSFRGTTRFGCIICLLVLCIIASTARAATPAEVDAAIKKAVAYIYGQQRNGNWEVVQQRKPGDAHGVDGWQWGGLTSVATCALLYAKESPQDPRMKQAIEWLSKADVRGAYAMGFRCQVWQLSQKNLVIARKTSRDDLNFLMQMVYKDGPNKGLYSYFYENGKNVPGGHYDHSVSQYGVLAMWALAQVQGIEIPSTYWKAVEDAWIAHQYPSGGWSYVFQGPEWAGKESMTMTAAGVATLFITQDYLHANEGLDCRGNIRNEHIERGIKWMTANFNRYAENPYYTLYGIERIGVASGYKYFGPVDWYQVGAEFLVRNQKPDGSWAGPYGPVVDTGFGLMFLIRGRAPVVMNKLDYVVNTAGDKPKIPTWNQRPRDVANITRYISKETEKDLNWQIVNLQAKVDDLHDSQILWISGKESLNFTDAETAKLKQFVEQGGLILGHADCASTAFATSFKKLGQKLFPYEFRDLPETHPIYTRQQYQRKDWRRPIALQGITNGARELMLLFSVGDPARAWQVQAFAGVDKEPHAQLMSNIFLYSVDKKNLRVKGETYIITPNAEPATRTIKVARLEYAGNWNPEPAGWRRLHAFMHNARKVDLAVETVKLGTGKLSNAYPVAHLTGTAKFTLTAAEQEELKKFVASGGTLIIDPTGGAGEFRSSGLTLALALGGTPKVLKPDHAVFSTGEKITTVAYRDEFKRANGVIRTPRLQAAEIDGKARIFFSEEDLSVGLVGQSVGGIYGYEPASATSLMANIIQFATGK